jgi:PAS domain S-box-containing protein
MLAILGAPREVVIGLNLLTLQGDPSRETIARLVRQTLAGRPARYEGRYTSQTGQKMSYLVALLAPIHGPSGVLGGVGIVEDVTERKRIETALARADRMASLGTLAAGVAHEINNPLVYVTPGSDRARAAPGARPSQPANRTGTACALVHRCTRRDRARPLGSCAT